MKSEVLEMMIAPQRMASGRYIDLGNIREEDIDLEDITISLNNITRFNGHHNHNKPLTLSAKKC